MLKTVPNLTAVNHGRDVLLTFSDNLGIALQDMMVVLYVNSMQKLVPWFFVCDQTNYARWLSVHIRDMLSLCDSHPDVYAEFVKGNFTASKTNRNFPCIALDQVHEQLNAAIKGDGGAVGLTESDAALCRWAVTGPEVVRMLQQFEAALSTVAKPCTMRRIRPHKAISRTMSAKCLTF